MTCPVEVAERFGTPTPDGPLVTVARVAALLHCGRSRVFELLAAGQLARGPKLGRCTVVRLDSVLALINEERATPKSSPLKPRRIRASSGQLASDLRAAVLRATGSSG